MKPIFDVAESAIGGTSFVRVTMPDGTTDEVYGLDSRDQAEQRGWLKSRRGQAPIGDWFENGKASTHVFPLEALKESPDPQPTRTVRR